jgi:2-phospho-L-lactate/phosphoenolpyruvate guanylyltransferase
VALRAPAVALVPFRDPRTAKRRLAGVVPTGSRAGLAAAMFADVVTTLQRVSGLHVLVLAGSPRAQQLAERLGVESLRDPVHPHQNRELTGFTAPERGLNTAVAAARSRMAGLDTLIVMADLPQLRRADVEALLAVDSDVAVAAASDGGTGGLLVRAGVRLLPRFGPGSASEHVTAARAAGLRVRRIELPGFAHDVDVRADLQVLSRTVVGDRTRSLLRGLRPVGRFHP